MGIFYKSNRHMLDNDVTQFTYQTSTTTMQLALFSWSSAKLRISMTLKALLAPVLAKNFQNI
ncbi:hypothetical protein DSUL_50243 [Desulfovibrionales bacterium]